VKAKATPKGFAKAAAGHVRAAAALLLEETDQARAVHLARRRIKRARSLVRALKPLAGEAAARRNAALHALATALSAQRDADALASVARSFLVTLPRTKGLPPRPPLPAIAVELKAEAKRALALPVAGSAKRFVPRAVTRAYRRARRAYRLYAAKPDIEPLHEARKRVKDCLHIVEACAEIRPRGTPPKPGNLDELAELMGALRDLDLLAARIRGTPAARAKLQRIALRRSGLAKAVVRKGRDTFRTPPRKVAKAWKRALR